MIKGQDKHLEEMSYEDMIKDGLTDEEFEQYMKQLYSILNRIPVGWESPEVKAYKRKNENA